MGLRNFVFELAGLTCRLGTIVKKSNERTSELLRHKTKKDVLKNRFISNCFMLVASSSPVEFSRIVFPIVKIRAKFEVALQKQFLSVVANQ